MSNYVDTNYSSSYVEGDTPSNNVQAITNVDIQFLKDEIATLKTMLLSITSSLSKLPTKDYIDTNFATKDYIDTNLPDKSYFSLNMPTKDYVEANLPTKDYIDTEFITKDYLNSKIPFVDDMSVKVFSNGTKVKVAGFSGVCEVISSSYLPYEEHTYIVVYTVSYIDNGVTKTSNFASHQVNLYVPEGT